MFSCHRDVIAWIVSLASVRLDVPALKLVTIGKIQMLESAPVRPSVASENELL